MSDSWLSFPPLPKGLQRHADLSEILIKRPPFAISFGEKNFQGHVSHLR
jgi:hypothetical protein